MFPTCYLQLETVVIHHAALSHDGAVTEDDCHTAVIHWQGGEHDGRTEPAWTRSQPLVSVLRLGGEVWALEAPGGGQLEGGEGREEAHHQPQHPGQDIETFLLLIYDCNSYNCSVMALICHNECQHYIYLFLLITNIESISSQMFQSKL